MTTKILFKKLLPNAVIPHRATEEAAGFDLVAAAMEIDTMRQQLIVDTGISTAFPAGYVLHIYGRSGLALKHGIRLSNCVAVIDSDYRGPLKVLLRTDAKMFPELVQLINIGERVGQAILVKLPDIEWEEVDELPKSVRGEGGFGSTGTSAVQNIDDVIARGPYKDFTVIDGGVSIDINIPKKN